MAILRMRNRWNVRSSAWMARLVTLLVLLALGLLPRVQAGEPEAGFLTGPHADRIVEVTQGWGELGRDTAVRPGSGRDPMALQIKDTRYEHGLGHHAPGAILVDLAGQFRTFECAVGIQWQGGQDSASVIFRVYVDDRLAFDSGIMRENDPPRPVVVDVRGANELRLVADDAGDGITCDCANWAAARLTPDPAAPPTLPGELDIAPFARLWSWDPAVQTGTRASRTDEFPAEDIAPGRELLPEADGTIIVPTWAGAGCVGLQWPEERRLRRVALEIPEGVDLPDNEAMKLQIWTGESAWQGTWQGVDASPERDGNRLIWTLSGLGFGRGTPKVRWVFPEMRSPITLKRISAYSRSRWEPVALRLTATRPGDPVTAEIEVYNGTILDRPESEAATIRWETAEPLALRVRSAVTRTDKTDRTVLRFRMPGTAFGVAVEDVVASGAVLIPHAGLFVTLDPLPTDLDAYQAEHAGKQTVLEMVRQRPDQTLAQAFAAVHNPVQDLGPLMISLACDNRKFVVHREGTVVFDESERPDDPPRPLPDAWRLVPRFGGGTAAKEDLLRRLQGEWLPIPLMMVTENSVVYEQAAAVAPLGAAQAGEPAWLRDRASGVVEFRLRNTADEERDAELLLTFSGARVADLAFREVPEGWLAVRGDRLIALIDTRGAAPLEPTRTPESLRFSGRLPADAVASCVVYLPAWAVSPDEYTILIADQAPWEERVRNYWAGLLGEAMQVELPDPLLTNTIRASQVHCLLAARNEQRGARVAPWISSDRYGPLESEAQAVIRGMDLFGHTDFARRGLEFFLHRIDPAGRLTTGYTLVGTGEHLWTLAEHVERNGDRDWLRSVAPQVARAAGWIVAQRSKTRRDDARGEPVPESGLMPPGVSADWNRFAYRFFNDSQYAAGLEAAALALAGVGHPDAEALQKDAQRYRQELLRSYHANQACSPVVRLNNGAWVLPAPALLGSFGRVEEFLPGEDGNRTWAYGIDLGAHHLAANRILDPASEEVGWMLDDLEDTQFLRSGMGDYPEARNRADVFNLGGFAKVQPYYARVAEVYALRDEVKPFLRAYFNAIPSLLSRETLTFWEHFHNIGGWNKTHETGWFLCQSRLMLVQERGDELWLAPMVSDRWLQDGATFAVRNAPTRFGPVGYTLRSTVSRGRIDAEIEPPGRVRPRRIVLRVRHPEGQAIHAVTVQGQPHADFDPARQTITIPPSPEPIRVRIQY